MPPHDWQLKKSRCQIGLTVFSNSGGCKAILPHYKFKNGGGIWHSPQPAMTFLGEGRQKNLGKMAKNRETYCYPNWGVVNSNRKYWPPPPGIKVFALLWFSRMPDQKYLLKKRKVSLQAKISPNFAALPSLMLGTFFKFW